MLYYYLIYILCCQCFLSSSMLTCSHQWVSAIIQATVCLILPVYNCCLIQAMQYCSKYMVLVTKAMKCVIEHYNTITTPLKISLHLLCLRESSLQDFIELLKRVYMCIYNYTYGQKLKWDIPLFVMAR